MFIYIYILKFENQVNSDIFTYILVLFLWRNGSKKNLLSLYLFWSFFDRLPFCNSVKLYQAHLYVPLSDCIPFKFHKSMMVKQIECRLMIYKIAKIWTMQIPNMNLLSTQLEIVANALVVENRGHTTSKSGYIDRVHVLFT